ncbi:Aste57867_21446 [Aphanomyces stellatus]|uniref:Aste57867_21446 protein n=1 Tax=Aphanomyces stellatus TaxID=120398 RepID=A0A485LJM5_9STRA|nr:hypothetical protein As57867_021377 [Aphanomyces stellatus]VFT98117.1 Aste57867_21446 [Aphanomyces stellatus]
MAASLKANDESPTPATRQLYRIPAVGETWVNGLSNEYEASVFPPELSAVMAKEDFDKAMETINQALQDLWPCVPCWTTGYACCICTLGLSLYCAWGQVSEAERCTTRQIGRVNRRPCFRDHGITWSLEKSWYKHTSWLVVSVVDK